MSRTGLWDSHAHLDDEVFNEDREQLIAQLEQDMDGIVNPGCDAASSAIAVELAEKYPFIYAAVGWHPENLKGIPADYLQQLAEWAQHPKVVAIGEIGLDYYWKENEPKEVQKRIFLEQIDLAKQFDLPVIIHDRDAHGDMLELFQKEVHGVQAVFHCFSGSLEMAKELVKRGWYIGFTGVVTFKNARKAVEVAEKIPLDRILIETDCPYMAPEPFRGRRCDPSLVPYVAKKIADLRGLSPEAVAAATAENAKRCFRI